MDEFFAHLPMQVYFKDQDGFLDRLFSLGFKRVFILTDRHVAMTCHDMLGSIQSALDAKGVAYRLFDGCAPPITEDKLREAVESGRAFEADAILTLGGGSVIDAGKILGRLLYEPADFLSAWLKSREEPPFKNTALPVFAVMTTPSLQGALNEQALVYDDDDSRYIRLKDESLYPDAIFISPSCYEHLVKERLLYTRLDIMIRAFEIMQGDMNPFAYDRAKLAFEATLTLDSIDTLGYASFLIHSIGAPKSVFPLHQMSDTIESVHPRTPHNAFLRDGVLPYLEYRLEILDEKARKDITTLFSKTPYASVDLYIAFEAFVNTLFTGDVPTTELSESPSEYVVELKRLFPRFEALSDEALYEIFKRAKE